MEEQLQKYFQGELTSSEEHDLMSKVRTDKALQQKYIALQNINAILDLISRRDDDVKGRKEYDMFIGRKRSLSKNIRRPFYYSVVAAVFLTLTVCSFWKYIDEFINRNDSIITIAESIKKTNKGDKVELILSGSERIAIDAQTPDIQYDQRGQITIDKKNLQTAEDKKKNEKVRYNQLVVPLGKRSILTLSDNTRLWVNAGTLVVYPVEFEKDKREIYVDGEVFFNVTRDEDRPFIVKTTDLLVSVLGTTFNVMAYQSDSVHSVVLEHGSVKIKSKEYGEELLKPSQMYSKTNRSVEIKSVDVFDYISWKEGIYRFSYEPLGNILRRLSRYYGVDIRSDKESSTLPCSGKLDLKEDITRVLDGLSETAPVSYQLKGEKEYLFSINHKKKAYD